MSKLAWPQSFTAAKKFLNDDGTLKECPGCDAKNIDFTKVKTKNGENMFVWQCEECGARLMAVAAADKRWTLMSSYKKLLEENGRTPAPTPKKQKTSNNEIENTEASSSILKEILESEKKLSSLIKANQKENFKLLTGITNLLQVRLDQYSAPSSDEMPDFKCSNEEIEDSD